MNFIKRIKQKYRIGCQMNHIYKTVLDRSTGVIKAVAENTSSHCKSQTNKGLTREQISISAIKKIREKEKHYLSLFL